MSDDAERVQAIVDWLALHPNDVLSNQFIADRTDLHRDTIRAARNGRIAQDAKIRALEQFIEDYEQDGARGPARLQGERTESTMDDLAVVELFDVYGVGRVVVRARAGNVASQVAETLRGIREGSRQAEDAE
jgi:hypothetical protein